MSETINPSSENKVPTLQQTLNRIISPTFTPTEGKPQITPTNKELTIEQIKKTTAFKIGDQETNGPDYLRDNLQTILGLRPDNPITSQDQVKIVEHLLAEIAKNPVAAEKDIKLKLPDLTYKFNIPEIIASLQVVGVEAAQQVYFTSQSTIITKETSKGWKPTDETFGEGSRRKLYTEMSGFGDEVVLEGESMRGIAKVGEKVVVEPTVEMDLRLAQVLFNTALPPEYSIKVTQLQQQIAAEKNPQIKDQKAHELTLLRQKLYKSVMVAFNTQTEKAGEIKPEEDEKDEVNGIAEQIKKRMMEVKKDGVSLQHMNIHEANQTSIAEAASYLGVSPEGQDLVNNGLENILMNIHAGIKMSEAVHQFLQDPAFENVSTDNKNIFEKILANRLKTTMSINGIESYYQKYNVNLKPENISLSLFLSMGVKGTELLYRRSKGEEIVVKTPEPVKPELPDWLNPKIKLLKAEQPEQLNDILKKLKEKAKDETTSAAVSTDTDIQTETGRQAELSKFNYQTLDLTFEKHLPSNIPDNEKSAIHELGRNVVKTIVTEDELGNLNENYRNVILNAAALNSANLLTPLIPRDERGRREVVHQPEAIRALAKRVLRAYKDTEPERIARQGRKLNIEDFVEIKKTYDALDYTPPSVESLLEGPLKGGVIPQQLIRGLVLQREFNRRFLDNSIALLSLPSADRNRDSLNLIAQITALQLFKEIDLKTYHLTSHGRLPLTPNSTDLFNTWDKVRDTPAVEVVRYYNHPAPVIPPSKPAVQEPVIPADDQTEPELDAQSTVEAVVNVPADEMGDEETDWHDAHAQRRENSRQRNGKNNGTSRRDYESEQNKKNRQKARRPRMHEREKEEKTPAATESVTEAQAEAAVDSTEPQAERKLPDWLFIEEEPSTKATSSVKAPDQPTKINEEKTVPAVSSQTTTDVPAIEAGEKPKRELPDWLLMKEPESSTETNATVTPAGKRELPSWLTDEELIAKDHELAETQAAATAGKVNSPPISQVVPPATVEQEQKLPDWLSLKESTPVTAAEATVPVPDKDQSASVASTPEDIFAKLRRELDETDKKVASPDDGEVPAFLRSTPPSATTPLAGTTPTVGVTPTGDQPEVPTAEATTVEPKRELPDWLINEELIAQDRELAEAQAAVTAAAETHPATTPYEEEIVTIKDISENFGGNIRVITNVSGKYIKENEGSIRVRVGSSLVIEENKNHSTIDVYDSDVTIITNNGRVLLKEGSWENPVESHAYIVNNTNAVNNSSIAHIEKHNGLLDCYQRLSNARTYVHEVNGDIGIHSPGHLVFTTEGLNLNYVSGSNKDNLFTLPELPPNDWTASFTNDVYRLGERRFLLKLAHNLAGEEAVAVFEQKFVYVEPGKKELKWIFVAGEKASDKDRLRKSLEDTYKTSFPEIDEVVNRVLPTQTEPEVVEPRPTEEALPKVEEAASELNLRLTENQHDLLTRVLPYDKATIGLINHFLNVRTESFAVSIKDKLGSGGEYEIGSEKGLLDDIAFVLRVDESTIESFRTAHRTDSQPDLDRYVINTLRDRVTGLLASTALSNPQALVEAFDKYGSEILPAFAIALDQDNSHLSREGGEFSPYALAEGTKGNIARLFLTLTEKNRQETIDLLNKYPDLKSALLQLSGVEHSGLIKDLKKILSPETQEAAATVSAKEDIKPGEVRKLEGSETITLNENKWDTILYDSTSAVFRTNKGSIRAFDRSSIVVGSDQGNGIDLGNYSHGYVQKHRGSVRMAVYGSASVHLEKNDRGPHIVIADEASMFVKETLLPSFLDRTGINGRIILDENHSLLFVPDTFNRSAVKYEGTPPADPSQIFTVDLNHRLPYTFNGTRFMENNGKIYAIFAGTNNHGALALTVFENKEVIDEKGHVRNELVFVDGRKFEDKDELLKRLQYKTQTDMSGLEKIFNTIAMSTLPPKESGPNPASTEKLAAVDAEIIAKSVKTEDDLGPLIERKATELNLSTEETNKLVENIQTYIWNHMDLKEIRTGMISDILASSLHFTQPNTPETAKQKEAVIKHLSDVVFKKTEIPKSERRKIGSLLVDFFNDETLQERYKTVAEYVNRIGRDQHYEPDSSINEELHSLLAALNIISKYVPDNSPKEENLTRTQRLLKRLNLRKS